MSATRNFWLSSKGLAAGVFISAVLYFLLTEHQAHFFQALPYLILLLCPLMHLFMHHGHGHGHGAGKDAKGAGDPGEGGHDAR